MISCCLLILELNVYLELGLECLVVYVYLYLFHHGRVGNVLSIPFYV